MDKETVKVIEESIRGFGSDNANIPCEVRYRPTDSRFDEDIRQYQGCPTIAITRGGRIYMGWYAGGTGEPRLENYNLLVYSDDDGKTFTKPHIIIESDRERMVHALDIQLWTAPNGALWLFWVQNNVLPFNKETEYMLLANSENDKRPVVEAEGNIYPDMRHTCWCIVCDDPDAEYPTFSEPRLIGDGFLRCKPLVLEDGRWILFNYEQLTNTYGYTVSDDEGKTFTRHYGPEKILTSFDETMAYQRLDGSIRTFARSIKREIVEFASTDRGDSWSDARLSGIVSPDTRVFVSRTPSGRVVLVNNDLAEQRERMSIWLSDDDGESWKYKKLIDDPSHHLTYPDADFRDGKIYVTYDRGRRFENEIHLLVVTEDEIMSEGDAPLKSTIVSKPKYLGSALI